MLLLRMLQFVLGYQTRCTPYYSSPTFRFVHALPHTKLAQLCGTVPNLMLRLCPWQKCNSTGMRVFRAFWVCSIVLCAGSLQPSHSAAADGAATVRPRLLSQPKQQAASPLSSGASTGVHLFREHEEGATCGHHGAMRGANSPAEGGWHACAWRLANAWCGAYSPILSD